MSKIYNTRKLQILALCHFMYDKHNAHYCGTGFLSFEREYIPFKKAVEMYNAHDESDKELKQLKLTYDKKHKKIVCANNLIKPSEGLRSEIGEDEFVRLLKAIQ